MRRPAPAAAGTNGRRLPAAARAFTLIEILVVIGIVLLLMGLVIGSVVSTPKLDRMLAAEQVLSDCIRQARHTARTGGQPVVLRLKKDERSISGLTRQILWSGVEDWPLMDDGAGGDLAAPGRTGTGLLPAASVAPTAACYRQPTDRDLATAKLERANRLWRGQAAPASRPGLMLSVAVRAPIAGTAGIPTTLPLALVGLDGDPSCEASSMGLALVLSDGGSALNSATRKTVAKSWEIIGWFGADGAGRVEVSSIADVPADLAPTSGNRTGLTIVRKSTTSAAGDVVGDAESGPLVGGRWTEITLLVDGSRLILYRDGRRVGEKTGAAGVSLPARGTTESERVQVGHMTLGGTGSDYLAIDTLIDDVRLERLGDAMAGTLPSGVKPVLDRRITCHPDGRVEVDGAVATGTAAAVAAGIAIELTADSGEKATVNVNAAGAVSTQLKAAP